MIALAGKSWVALPSGRTASRQRPATSSTRCHVERLTSGHRSKSIRGTVSGLPGRCSSSFANGLEDDARDPVGCLVWQKEHVPWDRHNMRLWARLKRAALVVC